MTKSEKILKSFSLKPTLNPKVWDDSNDLSKSKLKKKVRNALMDIADKFIDYLGDDVFVEDIILTGSLANYNWSQFSDFDLHVVIDFSQFDEDSDLYKELFNLKKQIFNDKHNIKIFGYDVELYAQDEKELHVSSGLYSIQEDEWKIKPKKEPLDIDRQIFINKISDWKEKIDSAIEDSDSKKLENLKDKLKEYRQCGLDKNGELSYENLVFKYLRRSGYVEKLFKQMNKSLDKELSIETNIQEQENKQLFNSFIDAIFKSSEDGVKSPTPITNQDSSKIPTGKFGGFTYLDLTTPQGYSAYRDICDNFINSRNSNAGINGEMMARSAKKYYKVGYVPPELALSQLAIEGGLSDDPNVKPRRTKNPFNVGNVDSGKTSLKRSVDDGVDAYYDLMTRNYLRNKKPEDLLTNFVNVNGNRYASSTQYESKLKNIIAGMSKYIDPVIAKYSIDKTSLS